MFQQPELGKKIADLRKAKGLTQEELVEKCNLNVRTLQRIESGEAAPRTYTLKLIFEALEYSFDKYDKKGLIHNWLEQLYKKFIDLFNLKTNAMKKLTILTLTFLLILTVTTFAQRNDEKLIRNNFERFLTFVMDEEGEKAVQFIDKATHDNNDRLIDLAKNVDSTELVSLPLVDQLEVLTMRYSYPKEVILKSDGREFLIYSINSGIGFLTSGLTLGKINIDGDFAKGQIIMKGNETDIYCHFFKEKRKWKINLLSLESNRPEIYQHQSEALGGQKQFIDYYLSICKKNEPNAKNEIWTPLQ